MNGMPKGPDPAATDPSAERSTMSREIWASPHFPKSPVCPEVFHHALPPETIVPSSVTAWVQQPTGTALIPCVAVQRKEAKYSSGRRRFPDDHRAVERGGVRVAGAAPEAPDPLRAAGYRPPNRL